MSPPNGSRVLQSREQQAGKHGKGSGSQLPNLLWQDWATQPIPPPALFFPPPPPHIPRPSWAVRAWVTWLADSLTCPRWAICICSGFLSGFFVVVTFFFFPKEKAIFARSSLLPNYSYSFHLLALLNTKLNKQLAFSFVSDSFLLLLFQILNGSQAHTPFFRLA